MHFCCPLVCSVLKKKLVTLPQLYIFAFHLLLCNTNFMKCYPQHIPSLIVDIKARGQRVYVSDVQESLFVLRYRRHENQLIIFADDTNQRWVTNSCLLDYDTAALADKFGNVAVVSMVIGVVVVSVVGVGDVLWCVIGVTAL